MARYSKAAQERREMDAAREAGSRSRELRSLAADKKPLNSSGFFVVPMLP